MPSISTMYVVFFLAGIVFASYSITINGVLPEVSGRPPQALYTGMVGAGNKMNPQSLRERGFGEVGSGLFVAPLVLLMIKRGAFQPYPLLLPAAAGSFSSLFSLKQAWL